MCGKGAEFGRGPAGRSRVGSEEIERLLAIHAHGPGDHYRWAVVPVQVIEGVEPIELAPGGELGLRECANFAERFAQREG